MLRPSTAFALLVLLSPVAGVTACGALKTAPAGSTEDGGDTGDVDDPGSDGGDETELDGGKKQRDARADAKDPTAVPCTEETCPVEEVAKDLYGPIAVAVNGTHVFWIEVGSTIPNAGGYGQLIRLAKGTTCNDRSCFDVVDPTVLEGELEGRYIYNTFIALGANDVCYTQTYNASPGHSISCFDLGTLQKRSLVTSTGASVALWVGATDARWAIGANGGTKGSIRGRTLDGGTAATLVPNRADPTSVASDGTSTYWTERAAAGAPEGNVAVLRADGGVSELATQRSGPIAVAIHGGYAYWLEYKSKLVMRIRTDGSGAPEQIATTDPNPFALVVDASGVYWASAGAAQTGSEGSIARAPLAPGGQTTVMMKNVNNLYALAADGDAIYAAAVGAQLGQGKILRLAKVH